MSNVDDSSPRSSQPAQFSATPPARPKSLGALNTALVVLLLVIVAAELLEAWASFSRASVLTDIVEGRPVTDEQADSADGFSAITSLIYLLAFIPTAVVFIVWQYRHAKNAQLLAETSGLGRPGWAIGGWFIPLANSVLPPMQLARSYKTSVQAAGTTNAIGVRVVVLWWLTFLIGGAIGTAAVRDSPSELATLADVETAAQSERNYAVSALILVIAAVLGIVVVRLLTKQQGQGLAAGRYAEAPKPWPPGPQDWYAPDPYDDNQRRGHDIDPWRTSPN